jgi:hypothetical protein
VVNRIGEAGSVNGVRRCAFALSLLGWTEGKVGDA